jgi:hypothetical protein
MGRRVEGDHRNEHRAVQDTAASDGIAGDRSTVKGARRDDDIPFRPAPPPTDDDYENKPVWPTWAVGVLSGEQDVEMDYRGRLSWRSLWGFS